jgi:hypothetical protein
MREHLELHQAQCGSSSVRIVSDARECVDARFMCDTLFRAQGVSRHSDGDVLAATNQMIDELGGCQDALHKFRDAAIFMKGGMGRDRVAFLLGLTGM